MSPSDARQSEIRNPESKIPPCSCPYCDRPVPADYCAPCGVVIVHCAGCGAPLRRDAARCPQCGALRAEEEKED